MRVGINLGLTWCDCNRSFVVSFKRFFVLVMHSFLGTGDPSMMGIKVLGDLSCDCKDNCHRGHNFGKQT